MLERSGRSTRDSKEIEAIIEQNHEQQNHYLKNLLFQRD